MGAKGMVEGESRRRTPWFMIILLSFVAAVMGGVMVSWLGGKGAVPHGQSGAAPVSATPLYYALPQEIMVNVMDQSGRQRFLQVGVSMMTHDPATLDQIKKHAPMIQDRLVMLFSAQSYGALRSPEGKEMLRVEALKTVRQLLSQDPAGFNGQRGGVEDLFFTSFVMQ